MNFMLQINFLHLNFSTLKIYSSKFLSK